MDEAAHWCHSTNTPSGLADWNAKQSGANATTGANADTVPPGTVVEEDQPCSLSRLLTWNCHTLDGVTLLEVATKAYDTKADIISVTETELSVDDSPEIQGYTIFLPKVSKSTKIRTVIYVRKGLYATQLPTPQDVPLVAVKVKDTAIISVYRQFSLISRSGTTRGSAFESEQMDIIESNIRTISAEYKTMFVLGDLNLDPNRQEEELYYKRVLLERWTNLMEELGLQWAPTGPTFKSYGLFNGNHILSTLDLVYSRSNREVVATVLSDGGCDHWPVLASLKGAPSGRGPKRVTRRDRNWQKINSFALNQFLLSWDWGPLLATTDVKKAANLIQDATTAAVDYAVPVREYSTPNLGVRLKADTRAVMRQRDAAKIQGRKHYKQLRNRALSLIRRDFVQNSLARIERGGTDAAWKICAEVNGKEKSPALPMPKTCSSDEEAANLCNAFYIDKVTNLRGNIRSWQNSRGGISDDSSGTNPKAMSQPPRRSHNFEGTSVESTFKFHSVGTAAVRRALGKLKAKPACGTDGVPILIYKLAWGPLALPLVKLINLVLTTGVWPDSWKESIVTPVLKAGKPAGDVSSYRPVALLPAISKLTERVMLDQLITHIESHNLLPNEQHGFRPMRGVDTAVARLLAKVAQALDKGDKISISAYDYSSAFDTIESEVLRSKLTWASEPAKSLLMSYMHDRKQRVRWNSATSEVIDVAFGVPQGSVLGPLLFILVTGDLPKSMTDCVGPGTYAAVSQYADDTSAISASKTWEESEAALQAMTTGLEEYSYENSLHLNLSKTQQLKICHPDTSSSDTLNILGIVLDRTAGFATHHNKVLADLRRRIGAVRRLRTRISRGSLLSEVAKSLIVGRVQCSAWVTRTARLSPQSSGPLYPTKGPAQTVLNDLGRLLLGIKRADRYKTEDIADRASLPTLNEIVVRQSAMASWKAANGGALKEVLQTYDGRTRGSADNLRKPISQRCNAASNMCKAWNASSSLREAKTMLDARRAARELAKSVRHL